MTSVAKRLAFGVAAFALALTAHAAEFEEGVDYVALPVPVDTRDPTKIEVVEVFSYACIHCYNLEPLVAGWLRTVPDDVDFRRMPLVSQRLIPFAQAFYTAEAMGVLERIHIPMFRSIDLDDKRFYPGRMDQEINAPTTRSNLLSLERRFNQGV